MLESLPDGIHSGLGKSGARGRFFYFQGRTLDGGVNHFWKYFDLKEQRIIDKRYIVANLIACEQDTPRAVDPDIFHSVFDMQERIIEDILRSFGEQKALEAAPRSVDPVQQIVATAIQTYLNHPEVDRAHAIELIRFLNQPLLAVEIRELRRGYKEFQRLGNVKPLITSVEKLHQEFGADQAPAVAGPSAMTPV